MKRSLLVLSASLLVMTACNGGNPSGTSASDSNGSSSSATTVVEYIAQSALDSLAGSLKLEGTYTVSDLSESDYTYSGSITTIYETNKYYTLDVSDYGMYEVLAENVGGNVALVGLSAQNVVEKVVYEDEDYGTIAWEDMGANPLTGLQASNFVKQSNGTYSATNALDRSNLALAAYGYYRTVDSVYLTVTNDKVTQISFTSALYTDDYGDTMQDSGTVTISEHGTATVPVVEPKPVVAEHQELETALASMAGEENFKVSYSEQEIDLDTGAATGTPTNWNEYYTATAYYSDYQYDISEDDTPVYVTQGFFEVDGVGLYQFSKDASEVLKLEANYPEATIGDLNGGLFTGFSAALFESEGNGVFTAYEDTVAIVAPYVLLNSEVAEYVSELTIVVTDSKIAEINYVYNYEFFGYVLGQYEVTSTISDVGTTTIPVDLTSVINEASVYASLPDTLVKSWKNDTHTLEVTAIGITLDDVAASNVGYASETLTFTVGDVSYSAVLDSETGELVVTPSTGDAFRLSLPLFVEMPNEAKNAVLTTFGVELTLPGVSGGEYEVQSGVDDDGSPLVIIAITNVTISDYVAILEAADFEVEDYTASYGCYFINDPNQELWIQMYEGDTSGV